MDDFRLNYTNATEWFYERHEGEEDEKEAQQELNEKARNDQDDAIIKDERSDPSNSNFENEQDLELLDVYPLTLPFRVGRIIKKMAPVTTFCATIPNNNHNLVLNNLNRTKSLDNLNFEEKRQLISSTLSLADILTQGAPLHDLHNLSLSLILTTLSLWSSLYHSISFPHNSSLLQLKFVPVLFGRSFHIVQML